MSYRKRGFSILLAYYPHPYSIRLRASPSLLEKNKEEMDAQVDFERISKLPLLLVVIAFLSFIGYEFLHGKINDLPEGTRVEDAQGILKSFQSGRGRTMCFVKLLNGEDLILRCYEPLYKVNVPISLTKVTLLSGEIRYYIKGEFSGDLGLSF